jgi:hypothetical protein
VRLSLTGDYRSFARLLEMAWACYYYYLAMLFVFLLLVVRFASKVAIACGSMVHWVLAASFYTGRCKKKLQKVKTRACVSPIIKI